MSKNEIKLYQGGFTGNIVIDAQEKSARAISEVERQWAKINNCGSVTRSLGAQSGDYALECIDEDGRSQVYDGIRVET